MLESVQRRWTKQIQGFDNLNYAERLRRLGLYSIKGRLNRADLIKIWKSFHPDVEVGLSRIFEHAREMGTRGHSYKLSIPLSNTDIKRRLLNSRRVFQWNNLSANTVDAVTLTKFKQLLEGDMQEALYDYV